MLPYDAVAGRLPAGMDDAAWDAIRPNLNRIDEAADWWSVVEGAVSATIAPEDRDYLAQAAAQAEGLDWNDGIWKALTGALGTATGRKGKALFLPLRLALTGREHGPDMNALLPLIGKARAVERLKAATV
jgi:glutamyl-tRNA synthetase